MVFLYTSKLQWSIAFLYTSIEQPESEIRTIQLGSSLKNWTFICHSTTKYLPKRNKGTYPYRYAYINVHHSFICYHHKLKTTQCLSVGEDRNKSWCTHTTEYYSEIKWNKFFIHVTTWRNPEIIILWKKPKENNIRLFNFHKILEHTN